jgi:hypothetical protein
MSNLLSPTYLNAYLVTGNSGASPLWRCSRAGNVWRIYLFGIGSQQ